MTSVEPQYDYFWDAAIAAVANLGTSVTGAFTERGATKSATEAAKEQSKSDISKAFYGAFGKTDTSGISSAATNIIGSSLAKKQSSDEAKKAQAKKYMYIGIAVAVLAAAGLALYFFLNKPTPAAA